MENNATKTNSTIKQIVQPGTCAWITSGASTEATYWVFQGLSRLAGEKLEKLALELGVKPLTIIEEAIIKYQQPGEKSIESTIVNIPIEKPKQIDPKSQIVDVAIENIDIIPLKEENISPISSLNMGMTQKAAIAKQLVESALQKQKEQTIRSIQTREKGFSTNITAFPTVVLPVTPAIMQINEPVEPKIQPKLPEVIELEPEEVEKIAAVTELILKAKNWGEIPQVSAEFSAKILAIAFKRLSLAEKKKVLMFKSFEHLLKDAKAKKQVTFYDISTDEDMFYCIVKFPDDVQETYTDSPINKSMLVDKILSFV